MYANTIKSSHETIKSRDFVSANDLWLYICDFCNIIFLLLIKRNFFVAMCVYIAYSIKRYRKCSANGLQNRKRKNQYF